MAQIQLKSEDGTLFRVEMDIVMRFKTIKTMLNELGLDGVEDEIVPLPNVSSGTLDKIIEWATHHRNDPVQEPDEDNLDPNDGGLSDWDFNFLENERIGDKLIPLMVAANYLDIDSLMNSCCKYAANLIKGKSTTEVREILHIHPPEKEGKSKQNTSPMQVDKESIDNFNENGQILSTSNGLVSS
ncbi:S-phase kinase-associated protein 1 [Nasonia vitripennis]|uniref:Uncharacterized protein n=1 Tax=Nasonia vitripennis TaxID=7425 RepID=A0A7M7GCK8_NASVI|nr:S-phase kinase-associated protein 1 [Nasonia vitripennis]XP_008205724.1 S-phase kinase-associated protein 1 [Nasonia vitripennis]